MRDLEVEADTEVPDGTSRIAVFLVERRIDRTRQREAMAECEARLESANELIRQPEAVFKDNERPQRERLGQGARVAHLHFRRVRFAMHHVVRHRRIDCTTRHLADHRSDVVQVCEKVLRDRQFCRDRLAQRDVVQRAAEIEFTVTLVLETVRTEGIECDVRQPDITETDRGVGLGRWRIDLDVSVGKSVPTIDRDATSNQRIGLLLGRCREFVRSLRRQLGSRFCPADVGEIELYVRNLDGGRSIGFVRQGRSTFLIEANSAHRWDEDHPGDLRVVFGGQGWRCHEGSGQSGQTDIDTHPYFLPL